MIVYRLTVAVVEAEKTILILVLAVPYLVRERGVDVDPQLSTIAAIVAVTTSLEKRTTSTTTWNMVTTNKTTMGEGSGASLMSISVMGWSFLTGSFHTKLLC
jgi:hypothetical protein